MMRMRRERINKIFFFINECGCVPRTFLTLDLILVSNCKPQPKMTCLDNYNVSALTLVRIYDISVVVEYELYKKCIHEIKP